MGENGILQLNTLKKNKEFGLVYGRGKSAAAKNIVIIYLPRKYGEVRVGFSVSKKVGCSVVRNKVRRRLKECLRIFSPDIKKKCHIIFVARSSAANAEFKELKNDMNYLLKKVGLL